MTTAEQTQAFADDIQRVVDRYRAEFELTIAAAVGVLELVKLDLYMEQGEK